MMQAISLSTLMCVAPEVVERVQRLEFAVSLIRNGVGEAEVRKRVCSHYDCSRFTAWRVVDMAKDVA